MSTFQYPDNHPMSPYYNGGSGQNPYYYGQYYVGPGTYGGDQRQPDVADYAQGYLGGYAKKQALNVGLGYVKGQVAGQAVGSQAAQQVANTGQAAVAGSGGTPMFELGAPSYAGYVGAALGAYNRYKNWDQVPNENKATYLQQGVAAGVGDVFTGGLVSAADGLLRGNKTTAKYMNKVDKLDQKTNPLTIALTKSGWLRDNRFMDEQNARAKLIKKGVTGWEQLDKSMPHLSKGRSRADLLAIEQANKAAGMHSNEKFATSRNEADLTPEDIWGYSAFGEKFGNDWLGKFSEDQRRNIAKTYLDSGAVKEGHGQIKLNSNADIDAKIKGLTEPVTVAQPVQQPQKQVQQNRIPISSQTKNIRKGK